MEDQQIKLLLGKILGEIYRIENRSGDKIACPAREAHIYGLLNGFERSIEEELKGIGFISEAKLQAVEDILNEYFVDQEKLKAFKGYYDIERRLEGLGIGRGEAITILTYLYADGRFVKVIDKMDSPDSPVECKKFELSEWDS